MGTRFSAVSGRRARFRCLHPAALPACWASLFHTLSPPPPPNPSFLVSLSRWYAVNDLSSARLGHTGLSRIPLLTPFMCNITALWEDVYVLRVYTETLPFSLALGCVWHTRTRTRELKSHTDTAAVALSCKFSPMTPSTPRLTFQNDSFILQFSPPKLLIPYTGVFETFPSGN